MGAAGRDVGDEPGELLVGEVPGALGAAVVEHQGLVEVVGLDRPEGLGGLFLRAVAAVAEQGDVLRAGAAQVLAEGPDHRVAGRLPVNQDLQLQDVVDLALARVNPGSQELLHRPDVVDAAPQPGDRRAVIVDADEEGVDRLHEGRSRERSPEGPLRREAAR